MSLEFENKDREDIFIEKAQEIGRNTISKGVEAMQAIGWLMLPSAEKAGPKAVSFIEKAFLLDWKAEENQE